jgi:HD-GYP domain-containing protein (c-di-GMP phosphodiesterase class II)
MNVFDSDGPPSIPGAFLTAMPQMRDPLLTSMARSLVAAVDAKDNCTRGHSERVQIVSSLLGETLGVDEATANDLYWASLLHDVGKIGVPDGILTKSKPLTKDEFASMQEHPAIGARLLEPLDWLANARPGVLHHHERIDGGGYPDGLCGEEIPLVARIIAVADTFDAMISRRHYRLERSPATAMEELIEVAGKQLDLDVVVAFESSFERVCEALRGASHVAEGLLLDEEPEQRAA